MHLKVLILFTLLTSCASAEKHGEVENASINGCERFSLISDSLRKGCDPLFVKTVMAKRNQNFEEKLTKAIGPEGAETAVAVFIRNIGTNKDTTCELQNDVDNPGKVLANQSASRFCPEVLTLLSEKVSDRDFALAMSEGRSLENSGQGSYAQVIYRVTSHLDEVDTDDVRKVNDTTVIVGKRLKQDCAKGVSESCNSVEAMKDTFSRLTKEEKETEVNRKEAMKHDPQKIFKMNYCKNPDLVGPIYYFHQEAIEPNCIYGLQGLYVIQSSDDGIFIGPPGAGADRTIFVKTKRQYADGVMVQPQFVRSIGLMKFKTVLGARRTINAFQYLGDARESKITSSTDTLTTP